MSITVVNDTSDVGWVRKLLTQAGRQNISVRDDDIVPIFHRQTIYADFSDLVDVDGVWLVEDHTHSGTNYVSGATVYPKKGVIELAGSVPDGEREVLITYATRDGLEDDEIQISIDMAKDFIQADLWETTLDYSGSSTYESMARHVMLQIGSYYALLSMNNSNAIQSGYNYRIAEFEIQTKLWGEGMIAETLLNKYWERSMKMLNALKLFQRKPDVPIYVVDRSNSRSRYNNDTTIFNTMMTMDQVTLKDSKSQYAIIMKIIG